MKINFSNAKDEFGKEIVPLKPLLLDRVMEGKAIVSQSSLFTLPITVLGQIVQYLSSDSLCALALVNSDCRQLARSQQFKSVCLNYSPNSSQLVQKMCEEGLKQLQNQDRGTNLGPAVRRLIVTSHWEWAVRRHGTDTRKLIKLDKAVRNKIMLAAEEAYNIYLKMVELSLSSGAFPNLELLDWQDAVTLPESCFTAFASCSIQHLRLYRVQVDRAFEIQLPHHLEHSHWPISRLYLEIYWEILDLSGRKRTVIPLTNSILRLCAPTLETLIWIINHTGSKDSYSFSPNESQYKFPRLRRLRLDDVHFSDPSGLLSLLGAETRIRELDIELADDSISTDFFKQRGHIQSLKKLHIGFRLRDECLEFLRANAQLTDLTIDRPIAPQLLEEEFLPLLSGSFHSLTSLSLVWDDIAITDFALKQISTLQKLRKLQLSAGDQYTWRTNWYVGHTSVREYLSKLQELRWLAFCGDSYYAGAGPSMGLAKDRYYQAGILMPRDDTEHAIEETVMQQPDADFEDSEEEQEDDRGAEARRRRAVFERIHRWRMINEANQYAYDLPFLEWVFIGQIPMSIETSENGERIASPTVDKRVDYHHSSRRIDGLPENVD